MGNASVNGGTFQGTLTNNGTFNYYQGDFSGSTLINNGTFTNNGTFDCMRLVNEYYTRVYAGHPVSANGGGYDNAVENNHIFVIYDGATLTLTGDKPFENNGPLYADGTLNGDLVNNNYFSPSEGSAATGYFVLNGDFTQNPGAELRIRLGGSLPGTEHDRINVNGHATLGGELDVRLINGFVPEIGYGVRVVYYASHSGTFNPVYLPALPEDREWLLQYGTLGVTLDVVEAGRRNRRPRRRRRRRLRRPQHSARRVRLERWRRLGRRRRYRF